MLQRLSTGSGRARSARRRRARGVQAVWQRQQVRPILGQAHDTARRRWSRACAGWRPRRASAPTCGWRYRRRASAPRLQRGRQRHQEAALQVTVEALDLALGPRPVRPAQPQLEAVAPRRASSIPRVPAVQPRPVERRARSRPSSRCRTAPAAGTPPKYSKAPSRPSRHVGEVLAPREAHERRAAVAERGDEREQRAHGRGARREVRLHLLARRRLEAHHRVRPPSA